MSRRLPMVVFAFATILFTSVTARANDDELRLRRRQLVITEAHTDCEKGTLVIRATNLGQYPPHVTLALEPLQVVEYGEGVLVAALPDGLCEEPATYFLTVIDTSTEKEPFMRLMISVDATDEQEAAIYDLKAR